MPLHRLEWTPGFNSQTTQTRNRQGWFACNLVRWRYGLLEKLGGWMHLFSTACAGVVRAMHAYEDLQANLNLGLGSDGGLQIYQNGTLYNVEAATSSVLSAKANGIGAVSMSSTATSTVVTVTDASYSPKVGQQVTFALSSIIGGIYLPGATAVSVVSSSGTSWTFHLPTAAATSDGGPYVPFFETISSSGTTKTVAITTGSSFTVPSDFGSLVSIEAIGAGGGANNVSYGYGNGGAAYAIQPTLVGIAAGNVYPLQLGTGGGTIGTAAAPGTGDTYFDTGAVLYAQGGATATSGAAGLGGSAAACIPTSGAFSGGYGGNVDGIYGGGGGGAAGKNGAGANGANASASADGSGGQGDNGTGGAGGVGGGTHAGGAGTEWSLSPSGTAGSGGGGAGNDAGTGGAGGKYGGGAGSSTGSREGFGAAGVIFFTYQTASPATTHAYLNWDVTSNHTFNVSDPFVVQQGVVGSVSTDTINIPAGTYTILNATSQTNMTIETSLTQPTSTQVGYEGASTPQFPINYSATPFPSDAGDWFIDNLGTNMLFCYSNGPLYVWQPPISTPVAASRVLTASAINAGMLTAMPQAQVITFGSEPIIGSGVQDPLLIRFSDAGSYDVWTASATNQAGSYRLGGSGSKIIGGGQSPQTTLIWTNNDLWSMQYVGPPFIYSFAVIASQCGLIAPHAFALIGRTTWWISTRSFFIFSDSGIVPVECPLWDIIFDNLDTANQDKIFAGASQSTNEVWFFYPSANGDGECDSYVKVNVLENLWDYGSLDRSAWLPENAFGLPLGADANFVIQQHEMGYDADGAAMAGVYAETGYADIADGDEIMFVDEFISDMKWFGTDGAISLTMNGVMYPGDSPTVKGPFGLDSTNRHIRPRFRARQIALRFDWADRLGFSARLGTPRIRVVPAGKRP